MTMQLALVEARRLLRNPYLWAVVAATLALLVSGQRNTLPNLAEVTITAAMATFLIAAALMVIANLATLRDQRERVPESLAALPGQAEARTRAVLLATGCLGAVLVAAVIGAHLLIRSAQGPAGGRIDTRELLAAAVAAAVMAALGVALGRWAPSSITGPAVLGTLAIGFFVGPLLLVAWHLPVIPPYEMQVFGRPVGPRLLYLAAMLVLLATLAVLRHGRRPLRVGVAAAALAAVVLAGIAVAAAAPPTRGGLVDQGEPVAGEPELECAERNAVTYCYFPGFESWVPYWARAAEPIAAALPPDQRHLMPTIAQRTTFGDRAMAGDRRAVVRMTWGRRGEAEVGDRTALAGQIAALIAGLPDPAITFVGGQPPVCDVRGQARTVVVLWLAGQAAPLRAAVLSSVGYGEREVGYARALLDRAGARDLIWEHWNVLLDPDTTIEAALPLLHLTDRSAAEPTNGGRCD